MRILQLHNFYQLPGGECAVVREEKNLLENAGIEVTQFVKDSQEIENMTLWGKAAMLTRIPYNKEIYSEIDSLVKRLKPDVAHIHNIFPLISPSVYAALNHAKVPIVQTHHNYRMLCPNALFYSGGKICEDCILDLKTSYKKKCVKGNKIISYLYCRSISKGWKSGSFVNDITIHIALNQFFANKLIRSGIPNENIRICGNFVINFTDKLTLKKPYFLFLGRLSPEKGLFTLLKAAQQTNYQIKIAGAGPLEIEIKQYISENNLKNITFVGYAEGALRIKLIQNALAVVVPSLWYESFALAAAEAQALGTLVIASKIGGLPEVVSHGKGGYLFQPGNVNELIDLLSRIANSPNLSMRLANSALYDAKEKFNPENHLKLLVDIYKEAILKFQN